MTDLGDVSAEAPEGVPVGSEQAEATPSAPEAPSRGNPAWDAIRSELGDPVFSKIERHLREFDSNHDRQVSKLNEQYKWAKDITAQGLSPQQVTVAIQLAQAIDETPEEVYQRLGQFLQQQGRMPQSAAELEQATDDPDEQEEDPRIAQLQQEQQAMKEFLQQQEWERQARQADLALDAELDALKQDTDLNLSKEDIREVLQRSAYLLSSTGESPPLAEVAQDYVQNVRNRILSTPRPGATAPRLVPATGGNAAAGQGKRYGEMSRGETQDLIASLIAQDNASAQQ